MFRADLGPSSGGTTVSHLKRIVSTNCCIHTVVPPDDGPRYARNMYMLTKYTKNKLRIKLVFCTQLVFHLTIYLLLMSLERLQLPKSVHFKCYDGWDDGINNLIDNVKYMRINFSLFKYLLYTSTQVHITHFVKDLNFSKNLRDLRFAHWCSNTEVFWDMTTCRHTVTDESRDERAFIFRVMQTERETDGP